MKKSIGSLFIFFLLYPWPDASGQSTGNLWHVDFGGTAAVPIRRLHTFATFGFGADLAVTRPIEDGLAFGGRVNYAYFFGRDNYKATNLFNFLADLHYVFSNNLLFGVNAGLGLGSTAGNTDAAFARIAYLGYEFTGDKNTFIFRCTLTRQQDKKTWG